MGTVWVTPSPESSTIPVVRPEAYRDSTAWSAEQLRMLADGTTTGTNNSVRYAANSIEGNHFLAISCLLPSALRIGPLQGKRDHVRQGLEQLAQESMYISKDTGCEPMVPWTLPGWPRTWRGR